MKFLINILFLFGLVCTSIGCSKPPQAKVIAEGSTVIAFGDSLTYGYGAKEQFAYPVLLAKNTGWHVINEGISGNTSRQVLDRVDGIIKHQPKLVLLGIGGNDVLLQVPSAQIKQNITQTIIKLKLANIPVVLIAEPHLSTSAFFGRISDNPIYAEIAKEQNIPLFSKEWSRILSNSKLKSDPIHANEQGYAEFTEHLQQYLKQQGYLRK